VKRFDVCNGVQMTDFNSVPLPDSVDGAQGVSLLPGGGMLVADVSVIARLSAAGILTTTYQTAGMDQCWLSTQIDADGTSFWASNWCESSVTRFDIATGNILESHVASPQGFMVKQILIAGGSGSVVVTNVATVTGGGETNISNNSASDITTLDPPAQPAPAINSTTIVNTASYGRTVAAGSITSVFGTNLAFGQGSAGSSPLPMTLAGSSVQIGGRGAPLLFASPTQVNLQIPWELAGQSQAAVTAKVGAIASNQQMVNLAAFAPGIFTLGGAVASQGAIVIAGTELVAAPSAAGMRPAQRGEIVSIYATGLGPVSNQPATGLSASQDAPLSITTSTPTVTIGGITGQATFSGLAPGAVGLYQVNVHVPIGVSAGDAVPVTLNIGGVSSNTVTIAVQ